MILYPSVYAIVGAPLTWKSFAKAAELWARPDGVLSHRAAAHAHGLEGIRERPIEIASLRALRPPGPLVHRPRRLPTSQTVVIHGLKTTNCARTLLDLCAVVRPWEAEAAMDSALRKNLVVVRDLHEVLGTEARRGRNGIRLYRDLVLTRDPEGEPGSALATDFLRWMRNESFPQPVSEHRIVLTHGWTFDVDFAYPELKIAFEVDGYSTHGNRARFDADRERDNLLEAEGWIVIRVTKRSLQRPSALRQAIKTAIRSRTKTL